MSNGINHRVKAAREETGKTQNEFALACGITQQALSKIESGRTENPTAEFVAKVSEQSGRSIEWLITGNESDSNHDTETPGELRSLFQDIERAFNNRSLTPALLTSFRSMVQALIAQQQDMATTAAADARHLQMGHKLQGKAVNLPPAAGEADKNPDLDGD